MKICFDKDYKVRVLDPVKFEHAVGLEKESSVFVDSKFYYRISRHQTKPLLFISLHLHVEISEFNDKVSSLVTVLETHAVRIDERKLKVRNLSCNAALRHVFCFINTYVCISIGDRSSYGGRE